MPVDHNGANLLNVWGKYVTFSALIPLLKHIEEKVLCEDTTLTADIKQQVITYLQDKYEDTPLKDLLYTASFLGPRFKIKHHTWENFGVGKIGEFCKL